MFCPSSVLPRIFASICASSTEYGKKRSASYLVDSRSSRSLIAGMVTWRTTTVGPATAEIVRFAVNAPSVTSCRSASPTSGGSVTTPSLMEFAGVETL